MSVEFRGSTPPTADRRSQDQAPRAPLAEAVPNPDVGAAIDVVAALEQELGQLRQALASRAPIEQAKGILMFCYGLDADRAFAVLARWSQTLNVRLRDVSAAVVDVVCGGPEGRDHIEALEEAVLRSLDGEPWRSSTPA